MAHLLVNFITDLKSARIVFKAIQSKYKKSYIFSLPASTFARVRYEAIRAKDCRITSNHPWRYNLECDGHIYRIYNKRITDRGGH